MSNGTFQPVKSKAKGKTKLTFCADAIYQQVWDEMKAEYLAKDAEFNRQFLQLPIWNQSSAHELSQQHQAWCEGYMASVRAEVTRRKQVISDARNARRFA